MPRRAISSRRQFLIAAGQAAAVFALGRTNVSFAASPRPVALAKKPRILPRQIKFAPRKIPGLTTFKGYLPVHFELPSTTTLFVSHTQKMGNVTVSGNEFQIDLRNEHDPLRYSYETKDKDVARMLIQVSIAPFTAGLADFEHPVGLVDAGACGALADGMGAHFVPLRLYNQTIFGDAIPGSSWAKAKEAFDRDAPPLLLDAPLYKGVYKSYRGLIATRPARLLAYSSILSHGTWYVRAIPLSDKGVPVGGPSNTVVIKANIPATPDIKTVFETNLPDVAIKHYEPLRPRKPWYMRDVIVIRSPFPDPNHIPVGFEQFAKDWAVGTWHILPGPMDEDDGVLAQLKECFGEIWETLNAAELWVVKAYAQIQDAALDVGCFALQSPGARTYLKVAMEIGMASLGIPPTLPTVDQLFDQGKDYLANVISDQVPLLTPGAAKDMINLTCKQISQASNGSGDMSAFVKPNPRSLYRPAYVTVAFTNNSNKPTTPGELTLVAATRDCLLFEPVPVYVPRIEPGKTLTINVNLKEVVTENSTLWADNYFAAKKMFIAWSLIERNPPGEGSDKLIQYKPMKKSGQVEHFTGGTPDDSVMPAIGAQAIELPKK